MFSLVYVKKNIGPWTKDKKQDQEAHVPHRSHENHFNHDQLYDNTRTFVKSSLYLPLEKRYSPSFQQTWIATMFELGLNGIGPVVPYKSSMHFQYVAFIQSRKRACLFWTNLISLYQWIHWAKAIRNAHLIMGF